MIDICANRRTTNHKRHFCVSAVEVAAVNRCRLLLQDRSSSSLVIEGWRRRLLLEVIFYTRYRRPLNSDTAETTDGNRKNHRQQIHILRGSVFGEKSKMTNLKKASEVRCTVVVVGDSRVGKTALIQRFVNKTFKQVRPMRENST